MGKHQLKELARIIDFILYHRPDEFGLFPDEDGSLPIKELHSFSVQIGSVATSHGGEYEDFCSRR